MGRAYFFLGNGPNTPGVFLASFIKSNLSQFYEWVAAYFSLAMGVIRSAARREKWLSLPLLACACCCCTVYEHWQQWFPFATRDVTLLRPFSQCALCIVRSTHLLSRPGHTDRGVAPRGVFKPCAPLKATSEAAYLESRCRRCRCGYHTPELSTVLAALHKGTFCPAARY